MRGAGPHRLNINWNFMKNFGKFILKPRGKGMLFLGDINTAHYNK